MNRNTFIKTFSIITVLGIIFINTQSFVTTAKEKTKIIQDNKFNNNILENQEKLSIMEKKSTSNQRNETK